MSRFKLNVKEGIILDTKSRNKTSYDCETTIGKLALVNLLNRLSEEGDE